MRDATFNDQKIALNRLCVYRLTIVTLYDPFTRCRCKSIPNCAKSRPKGLNPVKAVAKIKKQMVERMV